MFNELIKEVHANAKDKGFWDASQNVPEKMMLIVSELGEGLEALRKEKMAKPDLFKSVMRGMAENEMLNSEDRIRIADEAFKEYVKDSFEDEIADTVIRLLDLCGFMGIDLDFHIKEKMNFNSRRERLHGKKF